MLPLLGTATLPTGEHSKREHWGRYRSWLVTQSETARRKPLGRIEFTGMLAMTMATAALAIDLMLPGFDAIRESFGLPEDSTTVAQMITFFFLGMAFAQLGFGPLADRFGRKPVLYAGFGIYALGAVGAALAPTVPLLLASRLIWGVGAAAARVISQAVVRDRFEGDEMARALSYIMAVFILVPVIAPLLGALIVRFAPWQVTAWFCVAFVVALGVWMTRLPETLDPEMRKSLSFTHVAQSMREISTTRLAIGTTIGMMFLFGSFASYLASSELIVGQIYQRPAAFPVTFGGIAACMGVATFVNARLVDRLGAGRVLRLAALVFLFAGTTLLGVTIAFDGLPPFAVMVPLLIATLSMFALIFPNANTMALLPMGHIAGTAASVIGTITLTGASLLGAIVDRQYAGTLTPLPVAFVGSGIVAVICFEWAQRGRVSDAKASGAM